MKVCFLDALVRLVQDTALFVDAQDYEARSRLLQCAVKLLARFGMVSRLLTSQAMETEVLNELQNRKIVFEHADVESRGNLASTSRDDLSL